MTCRFFQQLTGEIIMNRVHNLVITLFLSAVLLLVSNLAFGFSTASMREAANNSPSGMFLFFVGVWEIFRGGTDFVMSLIIGERQ